ncbi:hypothetical protein COLO4_25027 [Corchorus olitorius]|uniref:Ycf3-interacting protein 1, chloroplastic n=1 Tax=Corchorus olitorius TaxID=93759 RepID=A0A1R3I567_9ROSI|nr:hypothetical protein COLO4_25027 [Corchorus olitorius]
MGTLQASQVPFASTCSSSYSAPKTLSTCCPSLAVNHKLNKVCGSLSLQRRRKRRNAVVVVGVGKEEAQQQVSIDEDDEAVASSSQATQQLEDEQVDEEDLQCVRQIQRVLELLRKNRDMIFSEVKLTVMIEDPREVERRRFLGIEDPDAPTRDDLVEALEQVNEGKIPKDRVALRMLAEEMSNWPNLEVEVPKKKRGKSLYAKATDTGVDPKEAARRLNIDWDAAAEIEEADDDSDDTEVPPAVAGLTEALMLK